MPSYGAHESFDTRPKRSHEICRIKALDNYTVLWLGSLFRIEIKIYPTPTIITMTVNLNSSTCQDCVIERAYPESPAFNDLHKAVKIADFTDCSCMTNRSPDGIPDTKGLPLKHYRYLDYYAFV